MRAAATACLMRDMKNSLNNHYWRGRDETADQAASALKRRRPTAPRPARPESNSHAAAGSGTGDVEARTFQDRSPFEAFRNQKPAPCALPNVVTAAGVLALIWPF